MVAKDTAAAAVAVGAVAAADTLAATPEDVVPVLSWVDEGVLWGAAVFLASNAAKDRDLRETFTLAAEEKV